MNPAEVTLRDGTEADRPWMIELAKRTVDTSVSTLRMPAPGAAESAAERLLQLGFKMGAGSAVAESPLERLGYIVWLHNLPDEISGEAQGFGMYLAVEPHARRLGIARKLMQRFEDAARAAGLPCLQVAVTEDNASAREMVAQLGYQTERRILCKRF